MYGTQTCIQSKLTCKVFSILSYSFALQKQSSQNFSGALTPEPPPELRHEPVAENTASPDPHLHFTIIL